MWVLCQPGMPGTAYDVTIVTAEHAIHNPFIHSLLPCIACRPPPGSSRLLSDYTPTLGPVPPPLPCHRALRLPGFPLRQTLCCARWVLRWPAQPPGALPGVGQGGQRRGARHRELCGEWVTQPAVTAVSVALLAVFTSMPFDWLPTSRHACTNPHTE